MAINHNPLRQQLLLDATLLIPWSVDESAKSPKLNVFLSSIVSLDLDDFKLFVETVLEILSFIIFLKLSYFQSEAFNWKKQKEHNEKHQQVAYE